MQEEYNNNLIFKLHDQIESVCNLGLEKTRIAKLALSAVRTVESRLDAVGLHECLNIAERYWNNQASEAELYSARMSAWTAIEGRTVDFSDPEVNLVRLLLCALYGRQETDIPQDGPLYIVLDFAINAKIQEKILLDLLRNLFQVELDANQLASVK